LISGASKRKRPETLGGQVQYSKCCQQTEDFPPSARWGGGQRIEIKKEEENLRMMDLAASGKRGDRESKGALFAT